MRANFKQLQLVKKNYEDKRRMVELLRKAEQVSIEVNAKIEEAKLTEESLRRRTAMTIAVDNEYYGGPTLALKILFQPEIFLHQYNRGDRCFNIDSACRAITENASKKIFDGLKEYAIKNYGGGLAWQ